ncbi:MAG: hypothetical protein JO093_22435 [Acidobacteria bacterium]|nr:hypothetical protein [Acidobacteriota bacterium]MBV9068227.1 hypothetical protein [Acidobacteriota bacterium]MBV9188383.1 hypothetical protein [Acidobacteriota bacterium]
MRSLGLCFALVLIAAAPLLARGRDVSGHYERPGENDEASLDIKMLPGNRVKVTGIALWNTKNEKYGPNIGELDFEADLKADAASWTDTDGYMIVIHFTRKALDVTEHGVAGHFGMNVTFAGHYARTAD